MRIYSGVDTIEIKRVKNSIEKYGKRFARRVYTDVEFNYCKDKKNKYGHLAVRFAAKEAVVKCFKTGFSQGIKYTDIEVNNKKNGDPYIKLYGKAQDKYNKLGGEYIDISLSHSKNDAVAFALFAVK